MVDSTRNRRACMTRCMDVNEAKGVCKDRSRWSSVISAYSHGKKACVYVLYVLDKPLLKLSGIADVMLELSAVVEGTRYRTNCVPGSRDPFKRDTAHPGTWAIEGTYRVFSQ